MTSFAPTRDLPILTALERKVLWLATWTIHNANHLRENNDGVKVGGHQASSASLATIMTALYFHTLRPQARVPGHPHAASISPPGRSASAARRLCFPRWCRTMSALMAGDLTGRKAG